MLRLLLTRFWPVLLPLIIYILWMRRLRKKAEQAGHPIPTFLDGPWIWAVASSLLIGIGCFILLGANMEGDGNYVPAHMEDGHLVPGEVDK